MKNLIKIFSSLLYVPLIIITIICGAVKYRLLNDNFWIRSFEKNNTYQKLQHEVINYLESKNANIFSELVTIDNIRDFTTKNITKVIYFINGKSDELSFYVPVSKIPKEMLPKKLGTLKENMSVKEIIQKFNINGIDPMFFEQFKYVGKIVNYVFWISLLLTIFVSFFTYPLVIFTIGTIIFMQSFFIPAISFGGNKLYLLIFSEIVLEISKNLGIVGIILMIISLISMLIIKIKKEKKHG